MRVTKNFSKKYSFNTCQPQIHPKSMTTKLCTTYHNLVLFFCKWKLITTSTINIKWNDVNQSTVLTSLRMWLCSLSTYMDNMAAPHSHEPFIRAKSPEDPSQTVNDHYLFQMLQGARDKNFRAGRQRLKGEIVLVIVHLVDGREATGMARYLKIGEWWRRRADRHFKQLKSQFNNH